MDSLLADAGCSGADPSANTGRQDDTLRETAAGRVDMGVDGFQQVVAQPPPAVRNFPNRPRRV